MTRLQVTLAAWLVVSAVLAPVVVAGPDHDRDSTASATDLGIGAGSSGEPACLVEREDLTLRNVSMAVRHQEGTPFTTSNLTTSARVPDREDGEPIAFSNDRSDVGRLCATFSLEHAPVKVIMNDVTLYDQRIVGRGIEQSFDVGRSERLVLYLTLSSAISLLPELLTATSNDSVAPPSTTPNGSVAPPSPTPNGSTDGSTGGVSSEEGVDGGPPDGDGGEGGARGVGDGDRSVPASDDPAVPGSGDPTVPSSPPVAGAEGPPLDREAQTDGDGTEGTRSPGPARRANDRWNT